MTLRSLGSGTVAAVLLAVMSGAISAAVHPAQQSLVRAAPAACTTSDLRITVGWHKSGTGMPGGGGVQGKALFTKKGGGSCTLSGWPRVRVLDREGKRLQIPQRNLPAAGISTIVLQSTSAKIRAKATLTWLNWCKESIDRPISLAVRLPHESKFTRYSLVHGENAVASCVNPTAKPVVQVSSFLPIK